MVKTDEKHIIMNILDRYIAKQIILTIVIVAFALLGFDLFFNLVHELRAVGKGGYTLSIAFQYIALTLPNRLYLMFPWSALIGSLICLGALANHSELVVMRTAGVSVLRITGSVLKAAIILMIFIVFLGEVIAPTAERIAQNKRTQALSGGQSLKTMFGLWVKQGQDFIHIKTIEADGTLKGITRYRFNSDRQLIQALYAEKGKEKDLEWELSEVKRTDFTLKETKTLNEETLMVPQLLDREILETSLIKHPERLSIPALWRAMVSREKNDLSTESYELAFWVKIFQPLIIIMMVFLSVPFVFGPLRTVSTGFRIVVGIFVAFSFHTINSLFSPLAVVYQFPPLLAVLLPIVVFTAFGFWMLKRNS